MAKAIINSYDGKTFKVNYFHGKYPESPGVVLLFSRADKKNLLLQKNLTKKTFNIFHNQGFHIMELDLTDLSPYFNPDLSAVSVQGVLSSSNQVATIIQDCYTCIEYFKKLFPQMVEVWLCSFGHESILALQIAMRMLALEKFVLIAPKIFSFDTQNLSSCTAQGLVIYLNNKKKKEIQTLKEVVNILRNQKKVYIDMVKIETNDEFLHTKEKLLQDVLNLYIAKNYSNKDSKLLQTTPLDQIQEGKIES